MLNNKIIIGLIGKKGSGKSTVANILATEFLFQELSYADPLKDMARVVGFNEHQINIDKNEINAVWGISSREFLQQFGTEVCRDLLPTVLPTMKNIWIRLMDQRIQNTPTNRNIVISDVRFLDEVDQLKNENAFLIRINRDMKDNTLISHSSETAVDEVSCDYILSNNQSISNLRLQVRKMVDIIVRVRCGLT